MAFSGKVDDTRDVVFFEEIANELGIADVTFDRHDVWHLRLCVKGVARTRVGERIQVDQTIVRVGVRKVRHEIGSDKAGAAGAENAFFKHGKNLPSMPSANAAAQLRKVAAS